jgi:hypothetical protein
MAVATQMKTFFTVLKKGVYRSTDRSLCPMVKKTGPCT